MSIEIRITNLPEDSTEEDIQRLLSSFCKFDRIKLDGGDNEGTLSAWIEVPTNRTHGYMIVHKINTLVFKGRPLQAYISLFTGR